MNRRTLYRLHAWIGLNLGLLLFVICLSGTLAVFSAELAWLGNRDLRAGQSPAAAPPAFSWQAMHDRVAAAHPHAAILYLVAPGSGHAVARALVAYSPRDLRTVPYDPNSGEVRAARGSFGLASFLRIFHKQFYIVPDNFGFHGTLVVGLLGAFLLVTVIAGLLSLRRWWRALVLLRRGRGRRLFWSDLHRMAGVWSLLVGVLLSVTGIWYFAEIVLEQSRLLPHDPPSLQAENLQARPAVLQPVDLDLAAAQVRQVWPQFEPRQIALPVRPGQPLVLTGQGEAWLVRDRANRVEIDPYSGHILRRQPATGLDPLRRWAETADPLHFGSFGGLATRILWFAAGLALCAGILAGLYTAWLRIRQALPHRPAVSWPRALLAMLPTLAILAASLHGAWAYAIAPARSLQQERRVQPLGEDRIGPWQIETVRIAGGDAGVIEIRFRDGHANFREASLRPAGADTPLPLLRLADRLRLDMAAAGCAGPCRLELAMAAWDGSRHTAALVIPAAAAGGGEVLPPPRGMATGELAILLLAVALMALPLPGWLWLQAAMPRGSASRKKRS